MKLRVRYTKLGKIRFISHRDGARLWERALRKVALPVSYTEGFTPRPKLSFGFALPTGAESVAEYIDIELVDGATIDHTTIDRATTIGHRADAGDEIDRGLVDALSAALPVGMDVQVIRQRRTTGDTPLVSLQDEVTSITWELSGPLPEGAALAEAARRILDAESVLVERERKGRRGTDDIRPLIRNLAPDASETRLVAELVTVGRALRPSELIAAVIPGIECADVNVMRTHQWIEHGDDRREVLSLPVGVGAPDRGPSA